MNLALVRQDWWQKSLVTLVAHIKYTEKDLKGLYSCLTSFACFKHFSASLELFTGPALGTWWNFLSGNVMAFTPCFSVFSPIRETQLNGFVGRWGACATQREGRTLCLKPIWSHWANSSTCLQCWMSWKIWSAAWRTTTQPTSGKWQGAAGPGFAARIQVSHKMAAVAFFTDTFFFKNSLCTCGTSYLETRDGLTAVRQLSMSVFFVLFFQQQKVFLPLIPSCQIFMSWCMLNVMHILCSVKLLFVSWRGSWLSGHLCYSYSDLFCSWHPLLTFVAGSYTCS